MEDFKLKKLLLTLLFVLTASLYLIGCSSPTPTADAPLRVGMDLKFYPYMYMDDDGNPTGLEVDIANAFGASIGKDVEIVNTDFSMLIPALDTGDIDIIISDMGKKPERLEKVDFSETYRYSKTLALVNKDFATKNNITDEMKESDFFAINGITFSGLSGTIATNIPQKHGAKVVEFTDIASALMEVTKGQTNVLIGASTIYGDHAANPDTTIVYSGISDISTSGFAVKKGNTELLEQANTFIASMYAEGGFYEQAGTKYDAAIGEFMKNDSLGLDYIIYPASGE